MTHTQSECYSLQSQNKEINVEFLLTISLTVESWSRFCMGLEVYGRFYVCFIMVVGKINFDLNYLLTICQ